MKITIKQITIKDYGYAFWITDLSGFGKGKWIHSVGVLKDNQWTITINTI